MKYQDPTPNTPGACASGSKGDIKTQHLLVVDADTKTMDLVRAAVDSGMQVRLATSVDAAQAEMLRTPADVVLVNLQIGDHGGVDLIKHLRRRYAGADIVALSRSTRGEVCLDAFRAGARDMLLAPFERAEIQRVLAASAQRRQEEDQRHQRHQRLRNTCRRLNKARHEIGQQVDLLCNDLVRAYQDMAQQLNMTQNAADFAQTLRSEIDVEGILRRTMEWILKKLGPLNAAIYLPSGEDQYALGAYLNLDTQADAALIEVLGKTLVRQVRNAALTIETDSMIDELFGEEGAPLHGRQWLAVACNTPRECLAVMVIFRSASGSGTTDLGPSGPARGMVEAAAPILAERIENAMGFYQRMNHLPEEEDGAEQ